MVASMNIHSPYIARGGEYPEVVYQPCVGALGVVREGRAEQIGDFPAARAQNRFRRARVPEARSEVHQRYVRPSLRDGEDFVPRATGDAVQRAIRHDTRGREAFVSGVPRDAN